MKVAAPSTDDLLLRIVELERENERLRGLLGLDQAGRKDVTAAYDPRLLALETTGQEVVAHGVTQRSSREEKVALFRSLFAGRDDVYAVRWESAKSARSGWSPAVRGGRGRHGNDVERELLPLTDGVLSSHLAGEVHAGVYPLMRGDLCTLLACDFDGPGWLLDALAYHDAAHAAGVPTAIERSRSGDGAHVWTFFSGAVAASAARHVGIGLVREAMALRSELDLESYDRLFPAQDFLPKGSFGNLIALPLQGECRRRGTTVFLDPTNLEPYEDQWALLSSVARLSPEAVSSLAESFGEVEAGPQARYRRSAAQESHCAVPQRVKATAGAMLAVDRVGLPPPLVSSLKHLASLHNPVFYEKERLRFSTHGTPRFVRCYRESLGELLLPRGLADSARRIVEASGSKLVVRDSFEDPKNVGFQLRTPLSDLQRLAFEAIAANEIGVLVAPPGAGKTVIACALIAGRDVPTLVVVDRKPLVEQWRERLGSHLGLSTKEVGRLEAGRDRQTGQVDLAMVQGLARRDDLEALTARYGLVVVDECHHVPAVTFERCVRQIPVRHWLGLTATPYRRDGLQALISMYCGPVRYDMTSGAGASAMTLGLRVHQTGHVRSDLSEASIQEVFKGLVEDDERTALIAADVADAAARGRNCLVLTQWTAHLERTVELLKSRGVEPLVLRGGTGKKQHRATVAALTSAAVGDGVVLVATGGYLGEGFDCPPLDALFLTFPIAFKGRIVQYVGRVVRQAEGKNSVEVHDYVDAGVPVLERMHAKRLPVFAGLGLRPT